MNMIYLRYFVNKFIVSPDMAKEFANTSQTRSLILKCTIFLRGRLFSNQRSVKLVLHAEEVVLALSNYFKKCSP